MSVTNFPDGLHKYRNQVAVVEVVLYDPHIFVKFSILRFFFSGMELSLLPRDIGAFISHKKEGDYTNLDLSKVVQFQFSLFQVVTKTV